jgi:hypothetical protein
MPIKYDQRELGRDVQDTGDLGRDAQATGR